MITSLSITDMYMSVLSSLSIDEKLDLIAKLTNSIRKTNKERVVSSDDPFSCFKGDWDDISMNDLRDSHTFTRTIDNW